MTYTEGDILHFYPEDISLIVVMSNAAGVRYIDTNDLSFNEDGSLVTRYASNEVLAEATRFVGNANIISSIAHTLSK